jgi:hypothetical protein
MWRQTELREALPPSARYPFMVQQTAVDGLHDIAGTGHLNCGFDGILQIVCVGSRHFASIAEFTR